MSGSLPLWVAVSGNTLVVGAERQGATGSERVLGYDLRDGRRRWHTDLGGEIATLAPAGRDRVAVLGETGRLWTLDVADGDRFGEDDGTMVRTDDVFSGTQLVRAGDTWVVVNGDGTNAPPLLGLRQEPGRARAARPRGGNRPRRPRRRSVWRYRRAGLVYVPAWM